ncbi:MAG: hypothetical protein V3W43_00765 [Desulfatiglandaceae bacterium]
MIPALAGVGRNIKSAALLKKRKGRKMYMNWADTKVPLLGNRTPKEAVKDPEGKRQVISLVKDWENLQARAKNPQFIFDFNKLRKELGLSLE